MKDLEILLEEDRREITEQTAQALWSGLAQRVVAGAEGRAHGSVWVPVVAALALVVCVAVYAIRELGGKTVTMQVVHSPVVKAPDVAAQAPRDVSSPKLVAVSNAARHMKKPLAPVKPFEVPGASREEERVLMELASTPSQAQIALQQKSEMDQQYEAAREEFRSRTLKEHGNDR